MYASRQIEEVASFPFDLKEEAVTLMMVNEPQIFEGPTQVIERVPNELELEGTIIMPVEADTEAVQEGGRRHLSLWPRRSLRTEATERVYMRNSIAGRMSWRSTRRLRKATRRSLRLRALTRSIRSPPLPDTNDGWCF